MKQKRGWKESKNRWIMDTCYEMLSSGHGVDDTHMNSLKLHKICIRSSQLKISAQKSEWFQMALPELES